LPAYTDRKTGNTEYIANSTPIIIGLAPRSIANSVITILLPLKLT